ncbi:exosortase C, VPDSG-CTERM-specific [Luteitalea pratensis]|uniref:Exosortase C, VPDSG-CTERM-specific n=1 Tax=Luteitalea pratensis TaxID=1855912 RepID=A0A143PW21_LUTPR|nr:exosortase/archaeosortase family protein [Luteitalea pratensis]AMY12957.1 exosortase C, VPDSG-CTERM-specific [Luteitalea pratensis]
MSFASTGHGRRDGASSVESGRARPIILSDIRLIPYLVVLTIAFIWPLARLMTYVAASNLHSYVLLVPGIAAYLLYERATLLPKPGRPAAPATFILAFVGAMALAASLVWRSRLSLNDYLGLIALAYVAFVAVGGFWFRGSRWMRAAAFPFAFLLFLVPLPDTTVDAIEKGSQFASAEAAAGFYHLAGTPLVRQGLRFELPNITLVVAQECSGIRSSLVLFITSIIAANVFLSSTWRRLALVLFVIPLGIIRNGFRVWVLGELCIRVGTHILDSALHHRGGPIFFALSLGPFFLVLWWLRRGERQTPMSKAA